MRNGQAKNRRRYALTLLLMGTMILSGCGLKSALPLNMGNMKDATQSAQTDGTGKSQGEAKDQTPDPGKGDKPEGKGEKSTPTDSANTGSGSESSPTDPEMGSGGSQSQMPGTPDPNHANPTDPNQANAPEPAPANTPIHPFYEITGAPPTAPGLAMKQRHFKEEPAKIAYLTIDDGPSKGTPRILEILRNEGIHATFFVIGRQVEQYPDYLKQEFEQGNAIGNHTYSHDYSEIYTGVEAYLGSLKKNEELIYKTIGIRPKIIRTPGGTQGHFNVDYYNAVDAQDYLVYDWNVSAGDADAPLVPTDKLVRNVQQGVHGKDRVIILLHDAPGKTTTVDALPAIIHYLKQQGYEFGVLSPEVAPILFPGGFRR